MKKCSKCNKLKEDSDFFKDSRSKSGLSSACKDCLKKWRQENSSKIKEYQEKYNKTESRKKSIKKYNDSNKDKRLEYYNSPVKFSEYEHLKKYLPIEEDKDGFLRVECKYCSKWFKPTRQQMIIYCDVLEMKRAGNGFFYCSHACKISCPAYHKKKDVGLIKEKDISSREVQPELRKMVLSRDNWTCQRCGDNKQDNPDVILHCHHIRPINEDPISSADIDNCITYCEDCHRWVHMNIPGCNYHELKC